MISRISTLLKATRQSTVWSKRWFADSSSQLHSTPKEKIVIEEDLKLPKFKPINTNFESLLKKPKSEESMTFNKPEYGPKYIYKFALKFFRRPYALELIQEIELFLFSKAFDNICCPTKIVCSKFSLFCLHVWLLDHRLSQIPSPSAWRMRRNLKTLLEDYVKDSVYSFQSHFDRDVYAELSRIRKTQFFSLDDFFVYQYKEKPLSQIITEDILLGEYDEDSPMVEHLESYILTHVKYLETLSATDIKKNHIYWGLSETQISGNNSDQSSTSKNNRI